MLWTIFGFFVMLALGGGIGFLVDAMGPRDPLYSVAINSFSGLADVRRGVSLLIRSSTSPSASNQTASRAVHACRPRRTWRFPIIGEEHVVARGVGVRLPGYVTDGLTTDMWNVLEVFDVTLRRSGTLDMRVTTTKM
jgi:hypothetical protein